MCNNLFNFYKNNFQTLDILFLNKDIIGLSNFFQFEELPITRMNENNCAGDYIQIIHNFTFGTYCLPKPKNVYICFTFIYQEEIDPLTYGYKDAKDILEKNNK